MMQKERSAASSLQRRLVKHDKDHSYPEQLLSLSEYQNQEASKDQVAESKPNICILKTIKHSKCQRVQKNELTNSELP